MLVLVWLIYNIWTILIKRRKYRVLPLLTFYIVATLLVLNRLYLSIWYFTASLECKPLLAFLGSLTSKFCLGLDQTWVNIELSLSLKHSLDAIGQRTSVAESYPHRFIKYGRIAITTFIFVFITVVFTIIMIADNFLNLEERQAFLQAGVGYYAPTLQITDFTLLTLSIIVLVYLVRK